MAFYQIESVTPAHRTRVRTLLSPALDRVNGRSAEMIIEAWAILWTSSAFAALETAPVSADIAYPLVDHTLDVVDMGRTMLQSFARRQEMVCDPVALDEILFLHDIDKLLLFAPAHTGFRRTPLAARMPHGVIAGILLTELGFSEDVISVVTTHATDAPFHGESVEAMVLNYADLSSIDYILMKAGALPFYRRSKHA
jgi:hypothetical protein